MKLCLVPKKFEEKYKKKKIERRNISKKKKI